MSESPSVVQLRRTCLWLLLLASAVSGHAQSNLQATVVGSASVTNINFTDVDGVRLDRVILTGSSAQITPPSDRPARVLYVDANDDIVMVDFSGAGTMTVSFPSVSGPALPVKYNQNVQYVKGSPTITIVGGNGTSRVRIAAVGRTSYPDATIFRANETYDGVADLSRLTLAGVDGSTFGEINAGNARFSGSTGVTGISATAFTLANPVLIGDLAASNTATPILTFTLVSEVRVLGGSLYQPNGKAITVGGFTNLRLLAGTDASNAALPAKNFIGSLESSGQSSGAPVAASPVAATFNLQTLGNLLVPASGSPKPTFTVASGTFPSWATLDSTSGLIYGTPPTTTGSPFSFVIRASNGTGTAALVSISITVSPTPATIVAPTQAPTPGAPVTLSVGGTGTGHTYRWLKDGKDFASSSGSQVILSAVQAADVGLYTTVLTDEPAVLRIPPAIVGLNSSAKVIGEGAELEPHDIRHPTGNVYDQVLLTGPGASVTADPGQATRISFLDLSNDIVQVEFAGAGTLSIAIGNASGPAAPTNYNQPTTNYVKGHAGLIITGADETTNISVFTVGRATAFDPTGGFNFMLPISATNDPANNGSSLFQGHSATVYDGYADIAYIAIQSTNGKFGGVRTANVSYWSTQGTTGVFAPGVNFTGPVYVHDITASENAVPVLLTGTASDVRVTGGTLRQTNNTAVQVGGLTQVRFTAGSSSHGLVMPAQTNQGRLERDGVDVTSAVVVNP